MNQEIKPLAPALPDAPPMVIKSLAPIGPFFCLPCQWRAWVRTFPVQRAIQLQAAWWKLELWSQAVRQNRNAN